MTLVLELPQELEASLENSAKKHGKPLSQIAIEAMYHYIRDEESPSIEETDPLLILAKDCWKGVPEEDADNWPVDFAENLKGYLHGARKTDE